jgi:hypothetical protein
MQHGKARSGQVAQERFIEAAPQGGIPAVCDTEFFRERIASNPANREHLIHMGAQRFIEVMTHWRTYFLRDANLSVIGASAAALGSITVPACVIPGNDRTHPCQVGENASQLLPGALRPGSSLWRGTPHAGRGHWLIDGGAGRKVLLEFLSPVRAKFSGMRQASQCIMW